MKKKQTAMRLKAIGPGVLDGTSTVSSGSTMKTPVLHKQGSLASIDESSGFGDDGVSSVAEGSGPAQPPRLHAVPRQVSFASEFSQMTGNHSDQESSFIYSDRSPSLEGSAPSIAQSNSKALVLAGAGDDDFSSMQASLSAESSVYDGYSQSQQQQQRQLALRTTAKTRAASTGKLTVKRRMHPREVDYIKTEKAKGAFR
jgi:hypothetical protein